MRVDQRMPAPNAVAAGQTTTFRLPVGRRYHALHLLGSATTFAPSDLTDIRIKPNQKVIQSYSGAHRDKMNQFDGREAAAISAASFHLVIPFDRYGLMTLQGEEETALNTGSLDPNTGKIISSLDVEIDLSGAGGITGTPSLRMYATTSERLDGGPGTVPHMRRFTKDFAGADTYDIADIGRGGETTQFINRIWLLPSTGTLENLKVEADTYTLFERTAALNERAQRDGIRVPQNGYYVIDRTEHGYGGDPFDVRALDDFRVKVDTSGAMSLTGYVEYLGGIGD